MGTQKNFPHRKFLYTETVRNDILKYLCRLCSWGTCVSSDSDLNNRTILSCFQRTLVWFVVQNTFDLRMSVVYPVKCASWRTSSFLECLKVGIVEARIVEERIVGGMVS